MDLFPFYLACAPSRASSFKFMGSVEWSQMTAIPHRVGFETHGGSSRFCAPRLDVKLAEDLRRGRADFRKLHSAPSLDSFVC